MWLYKQLDNGIIAKGTMTCEMCSHYCTNFLGKKKRIRAFGLQLSSAYLFGFINIRSIRIVYGQQPRYSLLSASATSIGPF